jgi:uncharacterized membrane protein
MVSGMTEELNQLIIVAVVGLVVLGIYLVYIGTIERVLETLGFSGGEAGTIILLTLFLGWLTIPMFPYNGWWVGISIGGALLPLLICGRLISSRRVPLPETMIGIIIVSFVAYFLTRAEEGVGIVADLEWAFMPALAAGLYAISTFWMDMSRAAPLAYVSGVAGTIVGADIFHLAEVLAFDVPADETVILSIGGANIFDMVYLTGIVAVIVAIVVYRVRRKQETLGYGAVIRQFESSGKNMPYAKDLEPAPPPLTKNRDYPGR